MRVSVSGMQNKQYMAKRQLWYLREAKATLNRQI
jgi:hypothetical protein